MHIIVPPNSLDVRTEWDLNIDDVTSTVRGSDLRTRLYRDCIKKVYQPLKSC